MGKHDCAVVAIVVASTGGGSSSFIEGKETKNELLYPISPYDEIPAIRDLFKQLSPSPRLNYGVQRQQKEMRQERQDHIKRNNRHRGYQERDGTAPPFDAPNSFSRFRDDPHEVPIMIEMPTTHSYSEDSELSLEECLRRCDEDYRDQRSLTPHPCYEYELNYQPTSLDVHHLYQASVKVDDELNWPSDEDSISPTKTGIMTEKHERNGKKIRHCRRVRLV
jgi:hypothetical protein